MLTKEMIVKKLKGLNLDTSQYMLRAGTAMVMLGIKESTNDIDMGATKSYFRELVEKYNVEPEFMTEDYRIEIEDGIEIYEEWIEEKAVIIDGIAVATPEAIIEFKRGMGREKDLRDIKVIERFIEENKYEEVEMDYNSDLYNKILNDKYILDLYEDVKSFESKDPNGWAYHDLSHILNVVKLVEEILEEQGYRKEYIEEAKVASLLHDLGCVTGKEDHAVRSAELAKKYLIDNNINLKYEADVLDAIKNHSDGFETENPMRIALIFADKLDIKKDRLSEKGLEIEGLKETRFINDINIHINMDDVIVEIDADKNIDLVSLGNYYFMPKLFRAIEAFSSSICKSFKVYMNNKEWNIEY
ncbi:MAG: HD domain-containing protein [Clostridia bacterium]|jgi:HD superfamily phosphohydrolase YqeK|nr:HD domain-containing protein [Clostridia bacterium]